MEELKQAYQDLATIVAHFEQDLPANTKYLKKLDCAVFNILHDIKAMNKEPSVDTVRGVFIEGKELYSGSPLREKTHIQICVCNPDNIKGVFRVDTKHF